MAKNLFFKGILLEVPEGSTVAQRDITFPYNTELHGVIIYPQNAQYGDIGDLAVINPVTQEVVGRYTEDAYLSPLESSIVVKVEEKDDPADILAGLIYRFTYNAVDTSGRKCIAWLRLKR